MGVGPAQAQQLPAPLWEPRQAEEAHRGSAQQKCSLYRQLALR